MGFLTDTFTDTDSTQLASHTPDSGGSWTSANGAYSFSGSASGAVITSNAVRNTNSANGAGNVVFYYSVAPSGADYSIYFTLYYGGANARPTGIMVRGSTAANSGYLLYCDPAAGFTLYRSVTASLTSLGSYSTSYSATNSVDVQISVSGTGATVSLEVFVDGVSRITASDTSGSRYTSAGNVLMLLYGGTDFRVDSISDDPPGGGSSIPAIFNHHNRLRRA